MTGFLLELVATLVAVVVGAGLRSPHTSGASSRYAGGSNDGGTH